MLNNVCVGNLSLAKIWIKFENALDAKKKPWNLSLESQASVTFEGLEKLEVVVVELSAFDLVHCKNNPYI